MTAPDFDEWREEKAREKKKYSRRVAIYYVVCAAAYLGLLWGFHQWVVM